MQKENYTSIQVYTAKKSILSQARFPSVIQFAVMILGDLISSSSTKILSDQTFGKHSAYSIVARFPLTRELLKIAKTERKDAPPRFRQGLVPKLCLLPNISSLGICYFEGVRIGKYRREGLLKDGGERTLIYRYSTAKLEGRTACERCVVCIGEDT